MPELAFFNLPFSQHKLPYISGENVLVKYADFNILVIRNINIGLYYLTYSVFNLTFNSPSYIQVAFNQMIEDSYLIRPDKKINKMILFFTHIKFWPR